MQAKCTKETPDELLLHFLPGGTCFTKKVGTEKERKKETNKKRKKERKKVRNEILSPGWSTWFLARFLAMETMIFQLVLSTRQWSVQHR